LLKAKYCPRVAAVSRTQKNTKHVTLIIENFIKLSAAVHKLSTVH